ncbi:patatin-like phospholipase domain-containing protein 4 [Saccoglossus kowalevskii]|uniref:Patatin-like phospholipase domain-containing protein 4-like n=1 Tax=Saccoglossus kowalevskii TaxID=10224 RepID=A0ABM0LU91_SACKO|nr:PREDICTED: patatin-like phospholipase domain-containing protein 4-like [Saccoglossus kowalevskii]
MNSTSDNKINLCFGGSTFLGVYQLGVAHSLYNNAQELLNNVEFYGGTSSGSIAAALLLLCPDRISDYMEACRSIVDEIRYTGGIKMNDHPTLTERLRETLDRILPQDNGPLQDIATNRLFIASNRFQKRSSSFHLPMTLPWMDPHEWIRLGTTMGTTAIDMFRNHFIDTSEDFSVATSNYESRKNLIEVLSGSCYIPIWGGLSPPQHNGSCWMDTGLTNNIPTEDIFPGFSKTITVAPFLGDGIDIGPKVKNISNAVRVSSITTSYPVDWTAWNFMPLNDALLPQTWNRHMEYFRTGYEDTLLYLKNGKVVRDEEQELCVCS